MKFSEMTTDRALDALCEITPYISNITSDKTVIEAVGKIVDGRDVNVYGSFLLLMNRLGEIVPTLLRSHRDDIYAILSVINEQTVDEIRAQNVLETMRQVREVFRDRALLDFFRSSVRQAATK